MGTKTRASGADARQIAAFETTYGTSPASGTYFKLPFFSYGLGADKPLETDQLLGEGREAQDPSYGDLSVTGPIVVPVDLRASGFWLKGLLGAPTTTGVGPYTHVFNSALAQLPSISLEIGHPQLSTAEYISHPGAKLGDCSIDLGRSGGAKATINVIAQSEGSSSSSLDAAPSSFALTRFMKGNGTVEVGGSSFDIMSGSLKFSNGLDPFMPIRSDGKIGGIDEGDFTASGSLVVRYGTNATIKNAIDAETPLAFSFGWVIPSTSYALTFYLPRVFLPRKKREVQGPKGIDVTYDWQCARDATEGYLLQATLVNDVDGY